MNIRTAVSTDFHNIVQCYQEYDGSEMAELGLKFDQETTIKSIFSMLNGGQIFLMEVDKEIHGFCAGVFIPAITSTDIYYAAMLLFVQKNHRQKVGKFIEGIKRNLIATKATQFVLASPGHSKQDVLDRYYSIMGFKLFESHYITEIPDATS